MSNESQTAANTPSEPVLCKMGCGFFGSSATGGCCSKCWRDNMKKQGAAAEAKQAAAPTSEPEPMEVEPMECKPVMEEMEPAPAVDAPEPATNDAKKKKKKSYINLMAGMMKSSPTRDVEKEKEQLRKVTGGGTFSKIDKI